MFLFLFTIALSSQTEAETEKKADISPLEAIKKLWGSIKYFFANLLHSLSVAFNFFPPIWNFLSRTFGFICDIFYILFTEIWAAIKDWHMAIIQLIKGDSIFTRSKSKQNKEYNIPGKDETGSANTQEQNETDKIEAEVQPEQSETDKTETEVQPEQNETDKTEAEGQPEQNESENSHENEQNNNDNENNQNQQETNENDAENIPDQTESVTTDVFGQEDSEQPIQQENIDNTQFTTTDSTNEQTQTPKPPADAEATPQPGIEFEIKYENEKVTTTTSPTPEFETAHQNQEASADNDKADLKATVHIDNENIEVQTDGQDINLIFQDLDTSSIPEDISMESNETPTIETPVHENEDQEPQAAQENEEHQSENEKQKTDDNTNDQL